MIASALLEQSRHRRGEPLPLRRQSVLGVRGRPGTSRLRMPASSSCSSRSERVVGDTRGSDWRNSLNAPRRWRRRRSCPASSGAPAGPRRRGPRRDRRAATTPRRHRLRDQQARAPARAPRRCSSPDGTSSARGSPRERLRGRLGFAPAGSPRSAPPRERRGPSVRPPIGSTRPWSVTSPVIPTVCLTGRPLSSDASAVVIAVPALGPSLGSPRPARGRGTRAGSRRCRCPAGRRASSRTRARSVPTPSSRRRAGP